MIFFDAYLDLEMRNLVSILAFDSSVIKMILSRKNQSFITDQYPIFYKNRHEKIKNKFCNAIDVALENNQIRAIGYIIDHVIEFQNDYTSFYLF